MSSLSALPPFAFDEQHVYQRSSIPFPRTYYTKQSIGLAELAEAGRQLQYRFWLERRRNMLTIPLEELQIKSSQLRSFRLTISY